MEGWLYVFIVAIVVLVLGAIISALERVCYVVTAPCRLLKWLWPTKARAVVDYADFV